MAGFRTRVSQIQQKYDLQLNRVLNKRFNKFGNSYIYAIHKLESNNLEKAIQIYKKINKL